eukprot:gene28667-34878_t
MSVAIVKAGAIVTIIAEKAADMDTAIKHIRQWSTMPDATLARLIRPTNRLFNAAVPTNNQIFSATTSTTITQPVCF